MTRNRDSNSPKPEEVAEHYASGYEVDRLHTEAGKLDCERSHELLKRFLLPGPATIRKYRESRSEERTSLESDRSAGILHGYLFSSPGRVTK